MDFERLYDAVAEPLLIGLTRRAWDGEAALDVWAETWAVAYAGRSRFRGSTDVEAEAWVYGIARKQYATYVRRGRAERRALARLGLERPVVDDRELAEIERRAGLRDLRMALTSQMAALPPGQREAIELRVIGELSYPEVAKRLRISEPNARARVSRGLRALAGPVGEALDMDGVR